MNTYSNKFVVLIPCAGSGARFGGTLPKQYVKIGAKTILEHTVDAFLQVEEISEIIIVVNANDNVINDISALKNHVTILKVGGKTRANTVLNGLNHLTLADKDWVLVHDAARCCIEPELIKKQIAELRNDDVGGILAIPVTDTVKVVNSGIISATLDRNTVYLAQTPQMFRYGVLKQALSTHYNVPGITDEASSVEKLGLPVRVINGSVSNIKVTYAEDLTTVQNILKK